MGDGARQPAGGGEFFHLDHAPFHLELFQLAKSGKVTQHGNGVRNLPALVINFPRTGIEINLALVLQRVKAQAAILASGKREGEGL